MTPSEPAPSAGPGAPNAAVELVDRHVVAGRGGRIAYVDADGACSYAQLAERVNRAGNALRALGVEAEQRVLLVMLDTVDFAAAFLGAIKVGAVPVPINTLLPAKDYEHLVRDEASTQLDGWEPTGQVEYRLAEGERVTLDPDGTLRLAGSGEALERVVAPADDGGPRSSAPAQAQDA